MKGAPFHFAWQRHHQFCGNCGPHWRHDRPSDHQPPTFDEEPRFITKRSEPPRASERAGKEWMTIWSLTQKSATDGLGSLQSLKTRAMVPFSHFPTCRVLKDGGSCWCAHGQLVSPNGAAWISKEQWAPWPEGKVNQRLDHPHRPNCPESCCLARHLRLSLLKKCQVSESNNQANTLLQWANSPSLSLSQLESQRRTAIHKTSVSCQRDFYLRKSTFLAMGKITCYSRW